jgi:transposase
MDALHLPAGLVLDETKSNPVETNDVEKLCTTYAEIAVPVTCRKCGHADNLYKYGGQVKNYCDSPSDGYQRAIVVKAGQRFKCRRCGITFRQQVDAFDPNPRRPMTSRCVRWIRDRCLIDTFKHVADHIGCDEGVVRNIAYEYMVELEKGHRRYLPEWLGIDETSLNGKKNNYVCVLVDAKQHKPIDVLPNREKDTVLKWLSSFGPSPQLRGVSMDMWRQYQEAVAQVFPEVPVVIDRFHVVNWANQGLTNVRRGLRKIQDKAQATMWLHNDRLLQMRRGELWPEEEMQLDSWLSSEPRLEKAYRFKEEFCKIYELKKKSDAAVALDKWRESVQKEMPQPFKELLRLTENWRKEILAYFDFDGKLTNGYTEGFNNQLKAHNRRGMGYKFEVLRARVIYGLPLKRKHIKLAKRIERTRKKLDQEKPEVAVTEGEIAATVSDGMEEWNKAVALLAQTEWLDTCDMCGTTGDIELLQHHFFFLPGVSFTGGPLENVYICSSCYDGLNQEQKEHIAINNEMEKAQWSLPAVLQARATFHGICDKCGTTEGMDQVQYHFDFLPGVSYTGAPLVNVFICIDCYEDHLNQERTDNHAFVTTSKSEVSQRTQAEFATIKSEEPKEAFTVVQNSTNRTSYTGGDLQVKASGTVGPARKRPPSHPILARDLGRLYQGLPPGEAPLPRKPRKKRRRWKLDDALTSHSDPDRGSVLLRAENEATGPALESAPQQSITGGEHIDSGLSEITTFAEASGDPLKQLSFTFSD